MLLTAPDSVKLFIMFLLLQCLDLPVRFILKLGGMDVCGRGRER